MDESLIATTEGGRPDGRLAAPRRRALVACLGLALALAGCGSKPTAPERADAPLPEAFSEAGDGERSGRWWQHFNDPGLAGVIDGVIDDNFSLAAARDRLAKARAAARRTAGGELPTVGGEANASSQTDYRAGAMAAYEVDLWGRLGSQTEAARLQAEATRRDLEAARISLSAEAARTYYALRREQALASLLRQQRQTNRRILELVEMRFNNGQAPADELLRQRQLIEDTQTALATTRGERRRLRAELAALQGLPGPQALDLPAAQDPPALPARPQTGVPAEWLQRRPDLEAAFLRVQSADAELAAAIAERYPRVDLTASLETAATAPSGLFKTWIEEIAASLTVPLLQGGRIEAEVDRTQAARAEAFNEYAQTVVDAVAAVETALAAEHSDRERLASLERRVAQGQKVLSRLRFRYRQGETAFVDVLRAQDELQSDQRERLAARWAVVIDRISLLRELAGAWDKTASNTGSS